MSARTLWQIAAASLFLCFTVVALAAPGLAIVVVDQAALRPAPRDSAKPHALLWQGDALEVRGEKMDYLQVYDHRLERGGYVSAKLVRRLPTGENGAAELLSVVRFLRESTGSEALGIGYAAAYVQAASAEALRGPDGAEVLDALGTFGERLARRAASGSATTKTAQAALSGHLEIAASYGVTFVAQERSGGMVLCYDGDAFRRVLESSGADPGQQARAALALTRLDCAPGDLDPLQRREFQEASARILDAIDLRPLPGYLRNRVYMRRAAIWNSLAFQRARRGEPAQEAAVRALDEMARVVKGELTDEDQRTYSDAAMRVNASRWAAMPAALEPRKTGGLRIATEPGEPGQTCALLLDAKHDAKNPLAKRCTYALVWEASATLNREGNAMAVAVQHTESWREMWVFRKASRDWTVKVLPPAATAPGVGYAEFAGWVPGGKQFLVAREASGEGKYRRSYEVLKLDSLAYVGQATDPSQLPAFQRWQDASWKQASLSLR